MATSEIRYGGRYVENSIPYMLVCRKNRYVGPSACRKSGMSIGHIENSVCRSAGMSYFLRRSVEVSQNTLVGRWMCRKTVMSVSRYIGNSGCLPIGVSKFRCRSVGIWKFGVTAVRNVVKLACPSVAMSSIRYVGRSVGRSVCRIYIRCAGKTVLSVGRNVGSSVCRSVGTI